MATERSHVQVRDLNIEVVRKPIKNLHLGVYPPAGRVRVAAPLAVNDDAVRLAVISHLSWIRRQQAKFEAQPRQSRREMVSGESHWLWGRRYRLVVKEQVGRARVVMRGTRFLEMQVNPGTSAEQRQKILTRWYRRQLRTMIAPLVEKWQSVLGVEITSWGVRQMKTRWGSCNPEARRVWLNLELACKLPLCAEFILVHELMHLLERTHNDRFISLMDRYLATWRLHRDVLNHAPLAHQEWEY